jgi:alkanesulfonate monooxygenase SsuD/methylene tetrahydromethanopterin reductase-like flavin-dependent oxidoreductase (luciferase family)
MIEGQEGVAWDQWMALAEACEELGFDALFRSDHYAGIPDGGRGSLDAWTTLAAIGARTKTLRLGTLVSPATFRHPSVLAKSVVTADHVTGGRVELGMGAGWFELEHREFGFPFAPAGERLDVLAEQAEIVHRLWDAGEPEVTFHGTHYTLEGCRALPKPVQQPHPHLIFGGGAGPRSAALAAKWADEYNVNFCSVEEIKARRGRVLAAFEAAGREGPPTFSFMTGTLVGRDESELHRRAKRLMEMEGETGDPKAWLESVAGEYVVGTVPQVLERLNELSGAGVDRIMMQHLHHDDLDAVRLIGEEVIPAASRLSPRTAKTEES